MLRCHPAGPGLLLAVLFPLLLQESRPWRDPSPHTVRFITVEKGVQLEVLDWGGSGTPLVLLAGGGNTAHVFDDFAPKLTRVHHVYGFTRRGFGASGFASSADPVGRLRDDVLAVIEALKLNRVVLAGHSIAGVELTAVATSHPERVVGLIYLEAAYPYAFDNDRGPTMKEFQAIAGPQPPKPSDSDLASFSSLQKWDERVYGFRLPEAEFRQMWDANGGGPVKVRDFSGAKLLMAIMTGTQKHADIPVPALVIFALPHVPENWMNDPTVRAPAKAYFTSIDDLAERQAKAVQASVPAAHVVRLRGRHYIFVSNELEVLHEIHKFVGGLN